MSRLTNLLALTLVTTWAGQLAADTTALYQHNNVYNDPVGYYYSIAPGDSVTIHHGIAGQVFSFEAVRWDGATYDRPGDIESIGVDPGAGPVSVTVVGLINAAHGQPYGAWDVRRLVLTETGVTGVLLELRLRGNLAEAGPVTADELPGLCAVGDPGDLSSGAILGDMCVSCLTGEVRCRSLKDLYAGDACWSSTVPPRVKIYGDFAGTMAWAGPRRVFRIHISGASSGTIHVDGTLDWLSVGGTLVAPADVHVGGLVKRIDLLGGVASNTLIAVDGDLWDAGIQGREDPIVEFDGTLQVGGYCATLRMAAELRGSVTVTGDLNSAYLARGCAGTLAVGGYLNNVLELGGPDTAGGLSGVVDIGQALLGDVHIPQGDLSGLLHIGQDLVGEVVLGDSRTSLARDLTGRVEVGGAWRGTLRASGRLRSKPNGAVPQGGGVAINGAFAGSVDCSARIQFDKGMGDAEHGNGEFVTCNYDGRHGAGGWGAYAEVQLAEQVFAAPDTEQHLYSINTCIGDMDNNDHVDFGDVGLLLLALTDPNAYADGYPGLAGSIQFHADCDGSGALDFGDVTALATRVGLPCATATDGNDRFPAASNVGLHLLCPAE